MGGILSKQLKDVERVSEMIKAFAHPLRFKILTFIDKNKSTNVNKIYAALKIEQSTTSQHLKILRQNNLVLAHRQGKFIFYSVNYEKIAKILQAMDSYAATVERKRNAG
ncbi:MAG: helix-turn-helix transcriptional regulator [Sphingobacteriales bacterium]|nr:helix-turn-helix transcriptional regulator [Sphingobacteriales bacterium]